MAFVTEPPRLSGLIKLEEDPSYCREEVTVLAGSGSDRELHIGTVLGRITVSGKAASARRWRGSPAQRKFLNASSARRVSRVRSPPSAAMVSARPVNAPHSSPPRFDSEESRTRAERSRASASDAFPIQVRQAGVGKWRKSAIFQGDVEAPCFTWIGKSDADPVAVKSNIRIWKRQINPSTPKSLLQNQMCLKFYQFGYEGFRLEPLA